MVKDSLRNGMAGITPFGKTDNLSNTTMSSLAKSPSDNQLEDSSTSTQLDELQKQLSTNRQKELAEGTSTGEEGSALMRRGNAIQNFLEPLFTNAADIWRQANVQGHSVNLSKKEDQLLNTEGQWLPQIEAAKEYLSNKQLLLSAPFTMENQEQLGAIAARNAELEKQLKNSARSNPYLQDIFYETNYGKASKDKSFGLMDQINYLTYDWWSDEHLADINPANNLKHMLSTSGLRSMFGTTHKLNEDQLNSMWNMKNNNDTKTISKQLQQLQQVEESAKLQYDEKNSDIQDKFNTLKKGNWLFDPTKINPEFTKEFENNELKFSDPKTWMYSLPHLGSSYSELATTVAQMGASAILNNVAKGALATSTGGTLPLLYAATEASMMMALNMYQRDSETASEAFDNYQSRVMDTVDKGAVNLDAVYQEVVPKLGKLGYDVNNMSDYELFQAMLASNTRPEGSPEFNQILDDSKKGLDVLRQTNQALSTMDYAESLMFSYGGQYLSKLYGANALKNAANGMSDKKMLATNLERALAKDPTKVSNLPLLETANQVLDRGLTRVVNKISNPISRIAIKDGVKTVSDIGKKMGVSYFLERTEEGQQYIVGKRYQEGQYDNVDKYSFADGLANAMQLGVEANAAYYGIHPDNNLNTDSELMKNMSIGGFTGLFMTGAYGAPDAYRNIRQTVTDVKLRSLAADDYARAEKDQKIEQFLKIGKGTSNFEYVYNTLNQLKDSKPEAVTDDMIDADISLAKDIYSYASDKTTKTNLKDLGIKESVDSDSYLQYMKNAIHIQDRYRQQSQAMNQSVKDLNNTLDETRREILSDDTSVFNDWIKYQYDNYKKSKLKEGEEVDLQTYRQNILDQLLQYTQFKAAIKLEQELTARQGDLQALAKEQKLDVNVRGISGILKYVRDTKKDLRKQLSSIDDFKSKLRLKDDEEVMRVMDDTNPVLPNQDKIMRQVMLSMINTGATLDIAHHKSAYQFGVYEGDTRLYKPTWNNLTGKQQQDIVNSSTLETTETLTLDDIIKDYNNRVNNEWDSDLDAADQKAISHRKALSVIQRDLLHREEQETTAKQEKEEQYQPQEEIPQQTLQEANDQLEEKPEPVVQDEIVETEQQVETPQDKMEEANQAFVPDTSVEINSEVQQALAAIDRDIIPEIQDTQEVVDEDEARTFEPDTNDLTAVTIETANYQAQDEPSTEIEVATNNATPTVTEEETLNVVTEIDNKINDQQLMPIEETPQQEGGTAEEVIKDKEGTVEEVKPKAEEEPVTTPVPEKEPQKPLQFGDNTPDAVDTPFTMLDGTGSEVFVDMSSQQVMWDPSGQMDMDNAIVIDDAALAIQQNFVDDFDDSPFYSPSDYQNSREQIDVQEGLDDKQKQKKNRVKSTFFYQHESGDVMPITVAGKPLIIKTKDGKNADRRPGRELAENLAIPGWLKTTDDIYYVVTSSTHGITKPYDDLAVHMLIEKDGKVYNTSLRRIDDALREDLKYLGLTQDEVESELNALRKLRKEIIDKYDASYFNTGALPTEALKHVKPVGLRVSNGTLNTQKRIVSMESSVPVYRKMTEVEDFRIPSDPSKLSEAIRTGEVELGYGVGAFTVSEPYSIMKLDQSGHTSSQGRGYAGKIYYVPKVANTPSQRVTLPIMLAEQTHAIKAVSADKVELAFDAKGNRVRREDGTLVPISSAELVFELMRREILGKELDEAILGILANNGKRTVTIGFDSQENKNLNFLVRKQLHSFENEKTGHRILITAGRKVEGDKSKGYNTRFTDLNTLTDAQKRQLVLDISRNIHWNTDKNMMMEAIPQPIIDAVLSTARNHPENNADYQYPFLTDELSFSLKDVGYDIKDGKITKVGETPMLVSWMINHGIIKTDLGNRAFKAPFVYADGSSAKTTNPIVNTSKTAEPVVKKETTSTGEAIKTEPVKKGATMAEPATEENLAKYGLSIPTNMGLMKGRVWGIFPGADGKMKVGQVPAKNVKGVYSVVQGNRQMDYKQAKKWLMDTLGLDERQIRVTNGVMRMLSDAKVYGVMQVVNDRIRQTLGANITLSQLAGEGIEYHEAWHYVSLLMLSPTERQALYQEYVDNNKKAKGATKQEVEEMLAEEFRSWMLKETNPSIKSKMLSFFRHIKEFLMKTIGRGNKFYTFQAIKNGYFKSFTPTQEAMAEFAQAYQNGAHYYIPGLSEEAKSNIPSITDSNVFYDIVDTLASASLAIMKVRTLDDVNNVRTDSIFDQMQEDLDNGWIAEESVELARDVIANKDVFKSYVYDKLEELKLKDIEKIETEEANRLAAENGDNPDNTWDKNQGDHSKKANVAFSAKLFFYSIPKTKYVFTTDEQGNVVKTKQNEFDPIFGLPIAESFDIAWNKVLENLWNVETANNPDDANSLLNRVQTLASTDPFFDSLHQILNSTEDPISEKTMTELLNTIKSSKNSMTTLKIEPIIPKVDYNASDEQIASNMNEAPTKFNWVMMDSDNLRKIARYPSQWSNAFFTSDNIEVLEDGQRRVSVGGYKYMKSRRDKINSIVKLATQGKLKDSIDSKFQNVIDMFLELTNGLMVPFDRLSLDYLLNTLPEQGKPTTNVDFNKFIKFWGASGKSFNGGILSDISTMYNSKKSNMTNRSNEIIRSLDRIFNTSDPNAQINLMAVAYGNTHPSPEEFSVTGADGNLVYPISENNYMSDQIRWYNSNTNGKKQQVLRTPYSKRSLMANSNQKLKLHTLIAINDDFTGTSRDYFGISPLEDYIAKLSITFNGHLTLPTMSDKKTWYSISGISVPRQILSSIESAFTGDLLAEDITSSKAIGRRFNGRAIDIMSNYFLDEFDAIVDYYQHKDYIAAHPEERVDNYHGSIKNGKMSDGGNGGRFRYFNTLNIGGETLYLNQELAKYEKYYTTDDILKYLNSLRELVTAENQRLLSEAMQNQLLYSTEKELNRLSQPDLGIITRSSIGYVNKLIPNNIYQFYKEQLSKQAYPDVSTKEQDILYSIIGTHVLQSFVSIQEVEKNFTGDPAYYKWQKIDVTEGDMTYKVASARDVDKTKRLSSVLSTGTNLRTYWGEGDPRNDTKFTVMNMEDNNVYSPYYEQLKDIFRTSLIRDMLSVNEPTLTDQQLLDRTNTSDKADKEFDNLSDSQKEFVTKQSEASSNPYGYREDKKTGEKEGNINQADAAVYIRPAMYKRIIEALGEWDSNIQEAFDLLEGDDESWMSDPEKYSKAINLVIKPLKMTYFGDHFNEKLNLNVPVYDKMAIFPMFKVLAKADNRLMYDRMNNEELGTIDMIAFESAIKVGGRQKFKTYTDAENTTFNESDLMKPSYSKFNQVGNLPTYVQDLSQLRLQLNTDPHEHIERSFGTQAAKIALGNTVDDRIYGINKGQSVKGSDIKRNVMDAIKALAGKGRNKVMRRFFKDGSIDNKALSDYLISQAKGSGLSRELLEGLSLDESGDFNVPLAAMSSRNWVESRVNSLVGKECVDINTPGGSAIQMASFGFKATGARKQSAIGTAFNNGNQLQFMNEDGSIEVMLSANFFRHVVPAEYQTSFNAMRSYLVREGIIGNDSKPFGIGYRIPTQGLSSTFSFKVADILPSSIGDVVVVPDEFTGMTGSDFDVDKIYIATRSYDINQEEGTTQLSPWNDELDAQKQTVGALQNRLIDMYSLVISDSTNMAETRASIDTLTKNLQKNILPLVQEKANVEAEPFYEMLPSFQLARKKEYTGGKMGIAPFALNSTNHCLTQLVHLSMNYSKGNPYGLGRLDAVKGKDGFRILDWLSAMINAHVDVAKDPYIMALNVNKVTYNMTSLLLRGGMGDSTFYFLAQPVLKAFADRKIANEGVYGVSDQVYDNMLIGQLYDHYEKLLKQAILAMDRKSEAFKIMAAKFNGWVADRPEASNQKAQAKRQTPITEVSDIIPMDRSAVFDNDNLIQSLQQSKEQSANHLYQQLIAMKAYNELADDAKLLGELVQTSQIDTKKYGNNLIDHMNFNNKYNTFIEQSGAKFNINGFTNQDDPKEALNKYFSETFLSKKLYLGTSLPRKILKYQTFTATRLFQSIFTSTMATFGDPIEYENASGQKVMGYKNVGGKDTVRTLGSLIESIVRARITRHLSQFNISDPTLVHMLYGKNTISKRLSGIKRYIVENKNNFPTLVNQDGTIRNELLNYLQEFSGDGVNQIMDKIKLFNSSMNNSKSTEDRLVSAFAELLESEDEVIREFANDLAKYAYITSYDNTGVDAFFNLVPVQWKKNTGYIQNIKDALYNFSYNTDAGASMIAEEYDEPSINYFPSIQIAIARNMWRDDNVVAPFELNVNRGDRKLFTTNIKQGKALFNVPLTFITKNTNKDFIKVSASTKDERTQIYRKIAEVGYTDEQGDKVISRSVYQLIPKLGIKDGNTQIYELQKESLDQSAFAANAFQIDATPDFDVIKDKALSSIKAEPNFIPYFETMVQQHVKSMQVVDQGTDIDISAQSTVDTSTSVVDDMTIQDPESYFGSELEGLEDFISPTSFGNELETATLEFGDTIVDAINVGEEFAMQQETVAVFDTTMASESVEDMSINENDFSDMASKICKG